LQLTVEALLAAPFRCSSARQTVGQGKPATPGFLWESRAGLWPAVYDRPQLFALTEGRTPRRGRVTPVKPVSPSRVGTW